MFENRAQRAGMATWASVAQSRMLVVGVGGAFGNRIVQGATRAGR